MHSIKKIESEQSISMLANQTFSQLPAVYWWIKLAHILVELPVFIFCFNGVVVGFEG